MTQTSSNPFRRTPYYQRLLLIWPVALFISDLDERLPDLAHSYCHFFGGFDDFQHLAVFFVYWLIVCAVANPMVACDAQAYLPEGARPLTRRSLRSIMAWSIRGTAEILVNARMARRLSVVASLYLTHFTLLLLATVVLASLFTALVDVGFPDKGFSLLFTNRCALP